MTTKSSDPLMLPDLPIDTRNKRALQQICWQLMRGEDSETFPGSQPVSFERRHLSAENPISIKSHEYMAAEKTDGVRYMLLVVAGRGAYMIDRNFEFKQLPTMHFPGRAKGSQLTGTLLAGELVLAQAARLEGRVRVGEPGDVGVGLPRVGGAHARTTAASARGAAFALPAVVAARASTCMTL